MVEATVLVEKIVEPKEQQTQTQKTDLSLLLSCLLFRPKKMNTTKVLLDHSSKTPLRPSLKTSTSANKLYVLQKCDLVLGLLERSYKSDGNCLLPVGCVGGKLTNVNSARR